MAPTSVESDIDLINAVFVVNAGRDFARAEYQAATKRLGDAIREAWPVLVRYRQVTALAEELGVQRPFLYRVRDGKAWT